MEIGGNHLEAVHSAAREYEAQANEAPQESERRKAALEIAALLREVQEYLLELIPESERWTYLPFIRKRHKG